MGVVNVIPFNLTLYLAITCAVIVASLIYIFIVSMIYKDEFKQEKE